MWLLKVLTQPGVATFAAEIGKASWRMVWVQLLGWGVISTILGWVAQAIFTSLSYRFAGYFSPEAIQHLSANSSAYGGIIGVPLEFFICMGLVYLLSKAFNGQGTFLTQSYTSLLFQAPLGVLSGILGLIPYFGLISFAVFIYGIVLQVFLAWALWIPAWLLHIPPTSELFQWLFLAGAFAPALGTIVVRRWITHEGFADAGLHLHLRRTWPYYLFAGLYPPLMLGGSLVLALAFGFSIRVDVLADIVPSYMAYLVLFPPFWGEEFGWRSYLQIRLLSARPLLAALATGSIWGVWHYPAVLAGYLPNEHGLLGVLLYGWYMIPFSIILGWLRLRTGSIWPPTLAHLANNAIGPLLLSALFLSGGQGDLLFSLRGWLAVIPLVILCIWIGWSGQLKPQTSASLPQARG